MDIMGLVQYGTSCTAMLSDDWMTDLCNWMTEIHLLTLCRPYWATRGTQVSKHRRVTYYVL